MWNDEGLGKMLEEDQVSIAPLGYAKTSLFSSHAGSENQHPQVFGHTRDVRPPVKLSAPRPNAAADDDEAR